jgi:hypothetical protein
MCKLLHQLCECPHEHAPPQAQPPPVVPSTGLPLLEAKNTDNTRAVRLLSQCSHLMGASAWLIGRRASNLVWQWEQKYS